jgi:serine protease inhibitor
MSLEASLGTMSLSISQEVMNVNSFGFRLLQKLSKSRASDSDGNVFLSPISVSTALAMAGVGATINSTSLDELEAAFGGMNLMGIARGNGSREHAMTRLLEDALGSQWDKGSGVELTAANGGWFKKSVLPRFKVTIDLLFECVRVSV